MTDQHEIVREVEAAYRHYVDVFNRRDPTEIAGLYDRPHAQVAGEAGLLLVNDDADQNAWYEFVFAHLDSQEWARTELDDVRVVPLSPTLAHVVSEVTRYTLDGSQLNHARANYTMRRAADGWKVVLTFPLLEEGFDVTGPTVAAS
jgi:ketosteroid isomerase-like protein